MNVIKYEEEKKNIFTYCSSIMLFQRDEAAQCEVRVAPPARRRDLPEGQALRLRGVREEVQAVLPEPLPHRQKLSGPQDPLLRRGALSLLCDDRCRL
jgi:hypothetical protein